ncbi:MAG: serine/threonine protein kinase [Candidatus Obscuribacterales bacterium]|nr:serine/threonine protein kinase [Candidatus Obscuribacterales bacterium]
MQDKFKEQSPEKLKFKITEPAKESEQVEASLSFVEQDLGEPSKLVAANRDASQKTAELHRASYSRRLTAWFIDNAIVTLICALPILLLLSLGYVLSPHYSGASPLESWLSALPFGVSTLFDYLMPGVDLMTVGMALPRLGTIGSTMPISEILSEICFSTGLCIHFVANIIYQTYLPLSKWRATFGQLIMRTKVATGNGERPKSAYVFAKAAMKVFFTGLGFPIISSILLYFSPGFLLCLMVFLGFDLSPSFSKMRCALDRFLFYSFQHGTVFPAGKELLQNLAGSKEILQYSSANRISTSKDHIRIRYKPYAAISRWFEQRFSQTNQWTSLGIVLISFILFAVLATIFLPFLDAIGINFEGIIENLRFLLESGSAQTAGSAGSGTSFLIYISYTLAALFATALAALLAFIVKLMLKPSHLRFDANGLSFERFNEVSNSYAQVSAKQEQRWEDLEKVSLQRVSGRNIDSEPALIFAWKSGKRTKVDLSSVPTMDEKAAILKAIDRWRKDVPIDAEVISCLEMPSEYSYTEVWMQALCAPPKRERLKPLIEGAVLKDGQYRVLKQLGAGGQGIAYLASDNSCGQTVVLKEMLLPVFVDMAVRKQALDRFEGECRILRSLNHPKVVSLGDFFVEDHRAYLVLEYIEGKNLKQEVKDGKVFTPAELKELTLEMCEILSYLHSCEPPVVHRDFTPDNLMLSSDGKLKLIDFNVANQQEQTATGTVVGKQAYMPLEQFQGEPCPQSDLYAMGATLYFLLTGEEPEALTRAHPTSSPCFRYKNLPPDTIAALDNLVAKATTGALEKRFRTVEEIRDCINSIDLGETIDS